jgi:DNA polymerase (family X)
MINNKEISRIFFEMADIADIKGDNVFKINALRRGGQIVESYAKEFFELLKETPEELKNISGLGEGLRKKIIELVETGICKEHQELLEGFPKGLLEMLSLRGVGPKKVKLFYETLGIETLEDLKKACEDNKISVLPKMGVKSQNDILTAISEKKQFSSKRFLISDAMDEATKLIEFMSELKFIKHIKYAGSLRRFQETVGDIDILVTIDGDKNEEVFEKYLSYPKIFRVLSHGDTKSSVLLLSGIQVDLRVVAESSFGASLHYFTGDKNHNIKIRDLAKRKGLKINEYGVYKDEKLIAGKDEKDIFDAVDLPFIDPEIRGGDKEIDYAMKNKTFPKFVELNDLKGDLHVHSNFSDGKFSMEEMVLSLLERGFSYIGFADHSSLMKIVNGLDENKIMEQWKEIDRLNKEYLGKIFIFKSCEIDIRKDGSLDFDEKILKRLDYRIGSVHLRYKELSREEQTKRVIRAISNPYLNILAHPTGRIINERAEIDMDIEKILKACAENNVVLEINSNPQRLDLFDKLIFMAKEFGAKFCINSDAHYPNDFDYLKYGVGMARRGWLEKENVINTLPLEKFKSIMSPYFLNKTK